MKTLCAERRSRYYITNEIAVDERFARRLADNGEVGDQRVSLWIAPEISMQEPSAILYLSTNGDPVYIGALNDDSELVEDSLNLDSAEEERPTWQVALGMVGISNESREEAEEAIIGLWEQEA